MAIYKKTDVSNPASLRQLFEFTRKETGKEADIVVPNAGVYEPEWSSFWGEEREEGIDGSQGLEKDVTGSMVVGGGYYKSMRVNLSHPMFATRLAIEGFLREKKEGRVVCVSSIAAQSESSPSFCSSLRAHGFLQAFSMLAVMLCAFNELTTGLHSSKHSHTPLLRCQSRNQPLRPYPRPS